MIRPLFFEADLMIELASQKKGFIGVESANNELGITVSYWKDLESIKELKENSEQIFAKKKKKRNGTNNTRLEFQK
jgi:heme-degrading monooxygenase HmoA